MSPQVLVKGDVFRYAQFDKDAKTTNASRAADASVFDEGFATATLCSGRNSRSLWHTSTGRASNAAAAARSAATFDLRDCMLAILLPRLAMVALNRRAGVCNDW